MLTVLQGPLTGMGICLIYGVAKHAIGYPSTPYPVPLSDPELEELTENTPEQQTVMIVRPPPKSIDRTTD